MATGRIIERLQGGGLETALLEQKLVVGVQPLAKRLAEKGSLMEVAQGDSIITENGQDDDVYFIITGSFQIKVHDRGVAVRRAQEHVGEMAALVPTAQRSATVVALEPSIVLKVSAIEFRAAAEAHPGIWQYIIKQLVERLNERNVLVRPSHGSSRIFIICSKEALPVAQEIERQLEQDSFYVKIWTEDTFRPSQYTLESLEQQLDESDFAIAIAQADDEVASRGNLQRAPRDNVIFELGLFVGRLGRFRAILLEPDGTEIRLPSDLLGFTTLRYQPASGKDDARLGPACTSLRKIFNELGPR